MSRIPLIDRTATSADRKALLDQVNQAFGATPNMFRAVANSPAAPVYFGVLKTYVAGLSFLHWINDALMPYSSCSSALRSSASFWMDSFRRGRAVFCRESRQQGAWWLLPSSIRR
jgi:hypothetical protein